MANPLGRPRGKGPGKYTVTDKAKAARARTAKSFRPGRRADTPTEKARAYKRDAEGRRLCLDTVEQVSEYLAANRSVNTRLDEALRDPEVSAAKLEVLARLRLSAIDLVSILREVNNRWGQPQRTIQDVTIRDMAPDFLMAAKETEDWDTPPEETHARPAGSGHAGNGAAH